ncbi:carbohydrate-binding domain-containing protein [Pseudoroseomonas sp. WGS1072]|uniref:carbohydrate-binding domain-containing protein n=1 Tax=Roseomonas sp. WGS1072 TaxID=3366816 RepID=UPI003BF274A2
MNNYVQNISHKTVYIRPNDDINSIMKSSKDGDTFVFSSGIYKNVTIYPKNHQNFIGEEGVVFDGSIPIKNWIFQNGFWCADGFPEPSFNHGEGRDGMAKFTEDLVVDGIPYQRVSALSALVAGAFYYENGKVYIIDNPENKVTEALSTTTAFVGGTSTGVSLHNITVQKYASMAQRGAIDAHDTQNWTLTDIVATLNHGAGVAAGDGMQIIGGSFHRNGQIGIHAWDTINLFIKNVEVTDNNYAGFSDTWDAGGIKVLTSRNVNIVDSIVKENDGFGIWVDWDNKGISINNNIVSGNSNAGIFIEASYDTKIVDNVVSMNNVGMYTVGYWGSDILVNNSSNVLVLNNQVISDVGQGIGMQQAERAPGIFGEHWTWNNVVSGNTIVMLSPGLNGFASDNKPGSYGNLTWNGNSYHSEKIEYLSFTWDNEMFSVENMSDHHFEQHGSFTSEASASGAAAVVPPAVKSSLILRISGDAYNGNPEFNVTIDGKTISGFSTDASHADGEWQDIVIAGDFGPGGPQSVRVDFTNDAWHGPGMDRNLYIHSLHARDQIYDASLADSSAGWTNAEGALLSTNGYVEFNTTLPPSSLILRVSGDAYNGNPEFNVTIDGKTISGFSTDASHADGEWQDIVIAGDFGPGGPQSVRVDFTNDAWHGPGMDRNLYIHSLHARDQIYDASLADSSAGWTNAEGALLSTNGYVEFNTTLPPSSLILRVSGDAYNGNPEFNVTIDGKTISGFSTDASHADGEWQDIVIAGDFGPGGPQSVRVDFTNDAWHGPGMDRNLYIHSLHARDQIYDASLADSSAGWTNAEGALLSTNGYVEFNTTLPLSSLILRVSGDAYNGNPEFNVTIDGKTISGFSTDASHADGEWQDIVIAGDFGPGGPQSVRVDFTNDAWHGPGMDRNLYIHEINITTDLTERHSVIDENGLALSSSFQFEFIL